MGTMEPKESLGGVVNEQYIANENRLWRMRWCFFWVGSVICVLWSVGVLVVSIVAFSITKNYFSFIISGGIAMSVAFLRSLADFLLPMDEKRFQLRKMKIASKMRSKRIVND